MEMLKNAANSEADEVMLDLEDSVAHNEKVDARDNVVESIENFDWGEKLLSVRINDLDTQYAYGDLITVIENVGERLDSVILPKARREEDIYMTDKLLTQIERNNSVEDSVGLEVLIELTEAVQNVDEIASASDRLETLIFGPGDYSVSLAVPHSGSNHGENHYPGDKWHHARTSIVNAARSNGLDAIDGPFADFSDPETYRKQCQWSRELGFVGKWAIHPSQIEIANDVYTPNEGEIDYAKKIKQAMQEAESEGLGAVKIDGGMVDIANQKYAQELLERAEKMDLVE
jgi:citrate lyase subunit beta/citryl-CoA lyase